jgi:hypothetical protein
VPRNPEIIVPAGKSTPGKSRHDISIFELILLVFVLLAAIVFFFRFSFSLISCSDFPIRNFPRNPDVFIPNGLLSRHQFGRGGNRVMEEMFRGESG